MTLAVSRNEIERYLARHLGWNPNRTDWDATQEADADLVIAQGLRWAYQPLPLDGEKSVHIWSFLKPSQTITTQTNIGDYDLPDDYGGIEGDISYSRDENLGTFTIKYTSEQNIRRLRQHEDATLAASGYPELYSVVPLPSDGSQPQRHSLWIWPLPQQEFELHYTYNSNPLLITGDKPYPMGGQPLSELILAAILASAESFYESTKGNRWQEFIERLHAAVHYDRKSMGPQFLGYNGNNRAGTFHRHERIPYVTFEGTRY